MKFKFNKIFLLILLFTFFSNAQTVTAFEVGGSTELSGVPGAPVAIDDVQITGTWHI